MKKFDLNIEKVLEDWGVHHALREIIANALDEQVLTNTNDVRIFKDNQGRWHIRDYGRGLKHEHLTQNENKEKLAHPDQVIGKFGVGLKDAFATFDRYHIKVNIISRHGEMTLGKEAKHGFAGITTLHVLIDEPTDPHYVGTEVMLTGTDDKDIALAKDFFLKFSEDQLLEATQYGQVLAKGPTTKARIYIAGLRVAEEDNFLFSYNITAVTKTIRKALNRERTNVGRTAYTDRVKAILLACTSGRVAQPLVEDLKHFEDGTLHDELQWTDVQVHGCKLLNAAEHVIFVTPEELVSGKDMVDSALKDRYTAITIPESVKAKITGLKDHQGNPVMDFSAYTDKWNNSFEFHFITENEMTRQERKIFRRTDALLKLIGGKPRHVKEVLISETMRLDVYGHHDPGGCWEPGTGRIIIKRDHLETLASFAGVLLHEAAHARSGAGDVSREFENELTDLLGVVASKAL
ncbi:MAG: ATP-binding protein [Acidiferrobacteraceae bacterium]